MKKTVLIMAILFASLNLYAAKAVTTEPDENGRIYNTAYFDIKPDGEASVYDVITYTKRPKTFNWEKLYSTLKNFKGDKIEFVISTRVEVPSDITTNDVYLTIGKSYYINSLCDHWSGKKDKLSCKENLKATKSSSAEGYYQLTTYFNEKKLSGAVAKLCKTKKDAFGNKYVDLKIVFSVDIQDRQDYIYFSPDRDVRKGFSNLFESISIKVAPKSRTFQNKWENPRIYVLDE